VAEPIVACALRAVREHRLRGRDPLEPLGRVGVVGVIWMRLEDALAVGRFDLVSGGIGIDLEHLVVRLAHRVSASAAG